MERPCNSKGSISLEFLLVVGLLCITFWTENYIHHQLRRRHRAIEELRNKKLATFPHTAKIQKYETTE